MIQYRTAILGSRKYKTRIKGLNIIIKGMTDEVEDLEDQIDVLETQISQLQSQITQLQNELTDAQELAQQRLVIVYRKNGYIQDLQAILDNEGIPYPPEPTA